MKDLRRLAVATVFLSLLGLSACKSSAPGATRPSRPYGVMQVVALTWVDCWRRAPTADATEAVCGDQTLAVAAEKECGGPAGSLIMADSQPTVEGAKYQAILQCMSERGWVASAGIAHLLEGRPYDYCWMAQDAAECPSFKR
jgi:hypothetical protein